MGPDHTLFPGLDGTPGDLPESTDITDQVLPPLVPDSLADYPLSDASKDVSVLSQIPNYEIPPVDTPPQAPGVAIVDGTPRAPEAPPARRSLNDRIDLLTGSVERGGRTYAEDQLSKMTEALLKQGQQIEAILGDRRTPAPTPAPAAEVDPITGQAATIAPAPVPVSAHDIEDIVTRSIQNYDSRLSQQREASSQLQLSQEDSYNRAAVDVPGLEDPATPVHKTFMKIWQRSPLKALPDGPYQVALQVQGLLAADAAANANLTQRKRQAAPGSPAPTATDTLGAGQVQALQTEYAKISQLIKAGSKNPDLMFKFRKIGRALGRTKPSAQR